MKILDVGCGQNPKGDVNGDLWTKNSPHTMQKINPKNIRNFIRLDAHLLPFKDNSFEKVISFHCLEHLEKPRKALVEMKRVSKGDVTIRVPIWHFFNFLIESLGLIKCFVGIPFLKTIYHMKYQIKAVLTFKKRYSVHLWYINSKHGKRKVTWRFGVPSGYEFTFTSISPKKQEEK